MVTVDGKLYRDGEISPEELLACGPERVTTSGPPPGEFLRALTGQETAVGDRTGAAAADDAVVVTVAGDLSGTYSAAQLAAKMSDADVEVVDSTSAAGGQALVAIAAARRACAGGSLAEVAQEARRAAEETRLFGCLESLENLARSGRVPGLAAAAAKRVGLRFMFELRSGRIRPLRPASGRGAAADRMVRLCVRDATESAVADVMVLEAGAEQLAAELRDRVHRQVRTGLDLTGTFGSAMVVHAGMGVAGLAWRWRAPE